MFIVEIRVYFGFPGKNRMVKNLTHQSFEIGNFGHPVSESWLRPWVKGEDVKYVHKYIHPPSPQEIHISFFCIVGFIALF